MKRYYIYIITNTNKTVLYIGVTNDLQRRLLEHKEGRIHTFTGRYNVKYLLYFEEFNCIVKAIAREKEIKKWRREKKHQLIETLNPEWRFLDDDIL